MHDAVWKAVDRAFAEADKAFAMADKLFEKAFKEGKTIKVEPDDHQHSIDFEAPTGQHRINLTLTFMKMAWRMLTTGKTNFKVKSRK